MSGPGALAGAVAALAAAAPSLPIPEPDPMPLPGPVWLFQGLLLVTFLLHLVPMNLVLGGAALATASHFLARRGGPAAAHHRHLAALAARGLPVAVAFSITLGVAPLLFVQVLYGQLFFTSSVLMAWPWLAVIALLLVGYYGTYWHALRFRELGRRAAWVGAGVSLIFLAIAFLFVNNTSLMQNPAVWRALYLASPQGTHLYALHDPGVVPRFLHFVLASLAVAGLAAAGAGVARRQQDPAFGEWAGRYGTRCFAAATAGQAVVGPWFLWAQPARVRAAFLGESAPDAAALGVAILLAVLALAILGTGEGLTRGRLAAAATTLGGTVALMVVIRHRVRTLWLEPVFSVGRLPASPQWGAVLLFALLLVAGLALVGWMLAQFLGSRPGTNR